MAVAASSPGSSHGEVVWEAEGIDRTLTFDANELVTAAERAERLWVDPFSP